MPYCRNCGAKLDNDARFCRVCGTPIPQVTTPYRGATTSEPRPSRPAQRTRFPIAIIAIIVIAILVVAAFVVLLFPINQVSFSQANEASAGDVQSVRLILNADIANVNVIMKDLPGNKLATTNISATGWRGIFGTDKPLALSFLEDTNDSTLTWLVNVSRAGNWPIVGLLNVQCDVYLDPSVNLGIMVHTETGTITIDADRQATFDDLVLQTTTGSVTARLGDASVIDNRVVVEATTGSVQFTWDNPRITGSVPVNVRTSTGSVNVNINQSRQLQGNVTLNAETSTGSVTLNMNLQNDVGAKIAATTSLGGINVQQQGFSGNNVPIQSNNYPATSNFDVTLRTTTGSININANSGLVGTRS